MGALDKVDYCVTLVAWRNQGSGRQESGSNTLSRMAEMGSWSGRGTPRRSSLEPLRCDTQANEQPKTADRFRGLVACAARPARCIGSR